MKRTTAVDRLAGPDHDRPQFSSVLDAVDASLAGMDWLTEADEGARSLVRVLAAAVDAVATNRVMQMTDPLAVLKEVRMTAKPILDTLEALGGTPRARGHFAPKPDKAAEPEVDPVAEALRQFQQSAAS
jgi:hypothetical protein